MNKYEEAIHKITFTVESTPNHYKLLQELVDRATPKKVTQFEHEGDLYCWCHKCNHVEKMLQIDFLNFCSNCGQKLDWSDDEH